jgi:hypothetical protein
MKFVFEAKVLKFPKRISIDEALDFYRNHKAKHKILMIMAAEWRVCSEPGEEDWFEELTSDEFEDEEFIEDFRDAQFLLCVRS